MIGNKKAQKLKDRQAPQRTDEGKRVKYEILLNGEPQNKGVFVYSTQKLLNEVQLLDLTHIEKVKLLHFYSRIYYYQFVYDRTDKERQKEGSPIYSQTLRDIYGKETYVKIRDTLELLGFIYSNHTFKQKAGVSKKYKVLDENIIPVRVSCSDSLAKKLKPPARESAKETPPFVPPVEEPQYKARQDFLLWGQSRLVLSPNWRDAKEGKDDKKKTGMEASASQFLAGNFYASTSESGRWFHFLTGCARELRSQIRIDGGPTSSIDIKAAQPAIIASFYPSNSLEKEKYLNLILSGKFYEYCAALIGKDISGPGERDAFKKPCLTQVFYHQIGDSIENYEILKAFKKEFPELGEILREFKQGKTNDTLSMHMQKLESAIVINGVIDYAIKYQIPVLPVHDALFCRTCDLPIVQGLLNTAFKQAVGFDPVIDSASY
jgi:hypothetical protein